MVTADARKVNSDTSEPLAVIECSASDNVLPSDVQLMMRGSPHLLSCSQQLVEEGEEG